MKKCWKCGIEKEVTDFYKGYAQCKTCRYEWSKAYRQTEAGKKARQKETINSRLSGKKQIRQKKYEKSAKGKLVAENYYKRKNATPEGKARIAAKNAVRYALRKGKIVKLPCFVCGEIKSEAHHPSYALDMQLCVTWLCSAHHNEIHNPAGELSLC
jgi:hypothetical protein